MPGFYNVNLPAFRAPGPLNFSGLNQGIDAVGKKLEKNRLLDQNKAIGSAIQADGYGGGADAAFAQGNLTVGGQLAGLESADEDRDFNRNRLLAQDARSAASDARSRELHGLKMQEAKTGLRDKLVSRVSGIAQLIKAETDPSRKAQMVQSLINSNPRMGQELSKLGLDPANPDAAMDMIIAEAQGLTSPTKKDLVTVSPGSTVYDPRSGQAVYTAPNRPASSRAISEGASKAANFANMMTGAEEALGPVTENPIGFFGTIRETLPEGAANIGRSPNYQAYRQAAMQWVRAKLRKESGAAISAPEFEGEFQTYFPQYGDGPEVIQQKNRAREQATRGMIAESRGAYDQLFGGQGAGSPAQPQPQQAQSQSPAAAPAAPVNANPRAINPQTGEQIEYNPQTGQWEPVQ